MCGISGIWDLDKNRSSDLPKIIRKMSGTLESRGPDDQGIWINNVNKICFGHKRLSILDLSQLGRQPMVKDRFVITYNGEIYNFKEIRKELESTKLKIRFNSNSDTEVILNACIAWGIEKTLSKISGMFAFALWDKKYKQLYLVRDKFGMKPLYLTFKNNLFLFSSQSKSFEKHPDWSEKINFNALASFFNLGYIPSNKSIYENTMQVPPGYYFIINSKGKIKKKCYWDIERVIKKSKNDFNGKNINFESNLEELINNSVKNHMVSDVPLGSFLSGGIDSSLISLFMQKNSVKPIKTFNVGFHEKSLDESKHAEKVAKYLKTDHHNVVFGNQDIIDLIPKLNDIYDEPFADSSQLPTILLSKITKKKVKVVLSGDAGDELFGGYNRYLWSKKIKLFYSLPKYFRDLITKSFKKVSPEKWNKLLHSLPYFQNIPFAGDKVHKLMNSLSFRKFSDVYPFFISQWQKLDVPLKKNFHVKNKDIFKKNFSFLNETENMQIIDLITYLPDDILVKVDRASMAFGLETRIPFLDEKIVEFAFSLPSNEKLSKKILKKILYKSIPKKIVSRPKMGFSIPLDKWLKKQLRDWAENLLQEKKLEKSELDSKKIRLKWSEHLSGKRNWQYPLWTVLVYQSWREQNKII